MNNSIKPFFFFQQIRNKKIKKNSIVNSDLDNVCSRCLIRFKSLSSWDRLTLGLSSVKRVKYNLCKTCLKNHKINNFKIKKIKIVSAKNNIIKNNNIKCSICLEKIIKKTKWDRLSNGKSTVEKYPSNITLLCNHIFHTGCINRWLENNDTCPNCRCMV
jgi:hypothetical protein